MSNQDLSIASLLEFTVGWVGDGPKRSFLLSSPISSPYMPTIDALHATLMTAPSAGSELATITDQLVDADADHDHGVRLSHALLTAFEMLRDAALAAQAKELRVLLIPEGVALVNKRYSDEAGLAAIRATQLTAEVRSKLAAFTLPSSMTLADVVDQMQAAAARIGTLLSRRRELGGGDGPTAGDLLDAKRQLIAMLEHVFASFHRLEATLDGTARVYAKSLHDEWLQTVKAASVAADRRRAAAAPATPPTPAGSAPPP